MTAGISSSSSLTSSSQPRSFASFIFLDDEDDVSRRLAAEEQIKFVCSYGGKILPRRPDGKLRYVGGHTRVVSLRRAVSFSELEKKLRELSRCGGAAVSLRCQLPTLDMDALVSVTSDDDLRSIVDEYAAAAAADRDLHYPLRIRAFLFFPPSRPPSPSAAAASRSSSFTTSSPGTSPPPAASPCFGNAGRELRSSRRPPPVPPLRVRRPKAAATVPAGGGGGGGGLAWDRRLQADRQNHHRYGHGTSTAGSFHTHH